MTDRFLHKDFPSNPVASLAASVPLRDAVQVWLRMILPVSEFDRLAYPTKASEIVPMSDEIAIRMDKALAEAAKCGELEFDGFNGRNQVTIHANYFSKPRRFNPAENEIDEYSDVKVSRATLLSWLSKFDDKGEPVPFTTVCKPEAAPTPPDGYIRLDEAYSVLAAASIVDSRNSLEAAGWLEEEFWNACVGMYRSLRIVPNEGPEKTPTFDTLRNDLVSAKTMLFRRVIPKGLDGDLALHSGKIICISRSAFEQWAMEWLGPHLDALTQLGNIDATEAKRRALLIGMEGFSPATNKDNQTNKILERDITILTDRFRKWCIWCEENGWYANKKYQKKYLRYWNRTLSTKRILAIRKVTPDSWKVQGRRHNGKSIESDKQLESLLDRQ